MPAKQAEPSSQLIGFFEIALSLLAGILSVLAFLLYAESIKSEEISRIAPLWQTIPLFVVVLAFVFLGERLPPMFYAAFAFIFFGSLLLSVRELAGVLRPGRPFWLMLLASILFAVQAVILKFAFGYAGFLQVLSLLCAGRVVAGIGLLAVPGAFGNFSSSLREADKRLVIALLLLGTVAIGAYNYAVYLGSVSIVEVLSGIYPFFVLLFATLAATKIPEVLGERFERKDIALKALAGALMFIGLALLYV